MTVESIHAAVEALVDLGERRGWPQISKRTLIQAEYVEARLNGQTHAFAEMCALQQPPGAVGTERAFLEGHCCGNQFEGSESEGDVYRQMARDAGVSTTGKVFKGGLARFPGDPQAWISDMHDAKAIADKENMTVSGAFSRQSVRGIADK
jgi:hypothetical protein